jgi:hypothetical protein
MELLRRKPLTMKFKYGRTALNDDPEKRRGRLRIVHTDEDCVIIEGLIREDRRLNVREIDEMTGIRHEIISDSKSARWVPKMPTRRTKA